MMSQALVLLIASAPSPAGGLARVLPYLLLGIVLVVVGGFVLVRIKRGLVDQGSGSDGPVLNLSDLRKLHREGQMSDEEFEAAKAAIIGDVASIKRQPPAPEGTRSAKPGFDLTGDPLPEPDPGDPN